MTTLRNQSPLKAIIIDDEEHSSDVLQHLISSSKMKEVINIVGVENDPRDGLVLMDSVKPDLLFLDIEMPFMNGFEFLESAPTGDYDVVFTTAYDKYALQAFRTSAVEYLIKPIKQEILYQTVSRIARNRMRKEHMYSIPFLLQQYRDAASSTINKIALPTADGIVFCAINEIVYCESDNNYSRVFKKNGDQIFISKTILYLEKILRDFKFLRVHRSYLVNFNFLAKYNRRDGGELILDNGVHIPISRSRKTLIMEFVKSHFPNSLS